MLDAVFSLIEPSYGNDFNEFKRPGPDYESGGQEFESLRAR
jgi:hypothetical protein